MKQGLISPFFFLLLLLSSCSLFNLEKLRLLTDFKNSVDNSDDFKKWSSVLNERGGQSGEVNFIFDNYQSKVYIVASPEFLSSLNGMLKSKNNYSCPTTSKYCSICINLKDSSTGCKREKDIPISEERVVSTSRHKVTLREILVAGAKAKETRMVFSGYPAELMLDRSFDGSCQNCFLRKLKLLANRKRSREASCFTDKKMVVCEALVSVKTL